MLRLTMQINRSVDLSEPATALEPASGDAPTSAARRRQRDDAGASQVGALRTVRGPGNGKNGYAALEAAAAQNPDVVVLDISMPGMNGFELAKRLRAAGSTARLVFLTVHEDEELILAARNAGGIGYVVKTRLASDLELAVREARAGRPFQSPAAVVAPAHGISLVGCERVPGLRWPP